MARVHTSWYMRLWFRLMTPQVDAITWYGHVEGMPCTQSQLCYEFMEVTPPHHRRRRAISTRTQDDVGWSTSRHIRADDGEERERQQCGETTSIRLRSASSDTIKPVFAKEEWVSESWHAGYNSWGCFCGVARWARDTISGMRNYVTVCGHRIRVCMLLACSITDTKDNSDDGRAVLHYTV